VIDNGQHCTFPQGCIQTAEVKHYEFTAVFPRNFQEHRKVIQEIKPSGTLVNLTSYEGVRCKSPTHTTKRKNTSPTRLFSNVWNTRNKTGH